MTGTFDFRLYVAGKTAKSIAALTNLTEICQEHLNDKCRITLIDILRNPQFAKADQIVSCYPNPGKNISSPGAESYWGPFQHRTRSKGIEYWFDSVIPLTFN